MAPSAELTHDTPLSDVIAADTDYDASTIDDNSETSSVASSLYRGYQEHGRRYQSLRQDAYPTPSDEQQFESMENLHLMHLILDHHEENPLFRSPIPEGAVEILDLGTGSGAWAVDCADQFPNINVRGVDLYPPPETWVPPNCSFEVDDVAKEWTWNTKFDLIHMRWLTGAFTPQQWDELYKQAYDNLEPGGWIEQVEPSIDFQCDDGTMPENSMLNGWGPNMHKCAVNFGRSLKVWEGMAETIKKAGFINVQEKLYKCPSGAWPKHPIYKDAGRVNMEQYKTGVEGYATYMLTKCGDPEPWTIEQAQVYIAGLKKELENGWHIWQYTKRVWAQKPFDA